MNFIIHKTIAVQVKEKLSIIFFLLFFLSTKADLFTLGSF